MAIPHWLYEFLDIMMYPPIPHTLLQLRERERECVCVCVCVCVCWLVCRVLDKAPPVLDKVVLYTVVGTKPGEEHGMVESCPGAANGAVHTS